MPTTRVAPGLDELLQEIANALWKSRKVVVVTGAGISTNSGIPDFRSENGLYSLIQAQFDTAQQQAADSTGGTNLADASVEERPAKRRRSCPNDANPTSRQASGTEQMPFPGLHRVAAKAGGDEYDTGTGEQPQPHTAPPDGPIQSSSAVSITSNPPPPPQDTAHPGQQAALSLSNRPTPSAETARDSPQDAALLMNHEIVRPAPAATDSASLFQSSPPSVVLGTPRHRSRLCRLDGLPQSSSPLSSPPLVIFDPYQVSTDCSSSQDSESSASESEESSATTPMPSSQTSFAYGRTSLPMMKGRDLFDAQIWSCPMKTSVFYTFVSTLREKVRSAEPTHSHRFVSVLRDSRKLVRCYTQNIDQLEERVGLSTSLSLGAGSRYRFSARSGGRTSGTGKGSAKASEGAPDASQGLSHRNDEQQEAPQPSHGGTESDDISDAPSAAMQPSQSASDAESVPTAAPSSTPSTSTHGAALPAPNRGVECVFLHGSLAELRCFVCARTASWDEEARFADTLAGRQPTCPHCAGATAAREGRGKRALGVGKLRPDIVLYGEEHPHAHLVSPLIQHDLSLGPDMLLILGTSLRVHGLKVLVKEFAKAVHDRGGKVVFVNFTKPPESVWADIIDYWVQWDCDAWVEDLQKRKPALWLPPGTTLPEEAKPKTAKLSRRQTGPEPSQRKDGTGTASGGCRGGEQLVSSRKWENAGLSIGTGQEAEAPPPQDITPRPPFPRPRAPPKRPAKVPREPKLNPDAKRPASVRDHKLNGAYLVWKIIGELGRITGERPTSSSLSPALTFRPTVRRSRKSAPAALRLDDMAAKHGTTVETRTSPTGEVKPAVLASSPIPKSLPLKTEEAMIINSDISISAAVKSRRRKRAVAWRMVSGVETQVSLDDAAEPILSLPRTNAFSRPPSPVPQSRRLPPPTPTSQRESVQYHSCVLQPTGGSPVPMQREIDIDAGFRETDRLIAQVHHESQLLCPSSHPATPFRLPPLRMLPLEQDPQDRPRLAALEPKLASPGPRAEISSNVGSPVSSRLQPGAEAGMANPFFFADPLARSLGYPPFWMEHFPQGEQQWHGYGQGHGQQQGYRQEKKRVHRQHDTEQLQEHLARRHGHGHEHVLWQHDRGREREQDQQPYQDFHVYKLQGRGEMEDESATCASGPGSVLSWSPNEQLRKEQEAALMLSALSGRNTY